MRQRELKFLILYSLTLSLSICLKLNGQTLTYDGFIHGHKVGEMKVIREVNDESTKISVDTHIEAHLLFSVTVDFTSNSTYMNNKLIIGEAQSSMNGHLKSSVHTVFRDDYYEVNKNGKLSKITKEDIVAADLYYFETPEDGEQVYALATGKILDIIKEKDGTFYFEHNGKKVLHTFVNGLLQELKISHKLYTITFKRRD